MCMYVCTCVCLCKILTLSTIYTSINRLIDCVIGMFGSLIWSQILMELILNPCGEFRWSPKGPLSQIHSLHLHVVAPGNFQIFQMLKREWGAESNEELPRLFIPRKMQSWFLNLRWKICLMAELQPWFLRLLWKTCPWADHSDDDDDRNYTTPQVRFLLSSDIRVEGSIATVKNSTSIFLWTSVL